MLQGLDSFRGTSWNEVAVAAFPGTSFWRSTLRLRSELALNAVKGQASVGAVVARKDCFFAGQRVAQRQVDETGQAVVYWLAGDHLGTTSLVLNEAGDTVVAQSRHHPYGEERWTDGGTLPTDYRWTGQREEQPLGIYIMGARWYDPSLGRWLSADTLVPEPTNPQAFNRYSYVYNNPIKLVDPSGHAPPPAVILTDGACPQCYDPAGYASAMSTIYSDPTLARLYELATDLRPGTIAEAKAFWDRVWDTTASVMLDTYADAYELATGKTVTGLEGDRGAAGVALLFPVVSSAAIKGGKALLKPMGEIIDLGFVGRFVGKTNMHHWIPRQAHELVRQYYPGVSRGLLEFTEPLDEGFHQFIHGEGGTVADAYNDQVIQWLNMYGSSKSVDEFLQFIEELRLNYLELYMEYLTGG